MTAEAHHYDDLHRLVDRLEPSQAGTVRAVLQLVTAAEPTAVEVDGIDGEEADETVRFGLDGVDFEIDLSTENATRLRDALAEYIGHARFVGSQEAGPERPRRQFSFAGSISAEPDFAERSEEILEEIARRNSV